MSKKIVYPYITFTKFVDEPYLKKLSLLFDEILVSENRFSVLKSTSKKSSTEERSILEYENVIWDFLRENKIVSVYPDLREYREENNSEIDEYKRQLNETIAKLKYNFIDSAKTKQTNSNKSKEYFFYHYFLIHDLFVRLDTLELRRCDLLSEYYPFLRTYDTFYSQNKKSQVIQLLLNQIPEPDEKTPWEQIIDYRSDKEIRNKYLALINWINKVANSNLSLAEINDQYEYLYNDYNKHFKLHKMKYHNSTLEIILNATTNFILNIASGNYLSSVKDLFQFKIKNANLLQEETKLPGREIAYIYETKSKFA